MVEQTSPAPKVVALNVSQWKAVVLNDVTQLHQALVQIVAPSDADIANIEQFLGNTRHMLHGWKVAGAQLAAQQAAVEAHVAPEPTVDEVRRKSLEQQATAHATNGATPPKKKGGWPKGKKRNAPQHPAVTQ